MTASHMARARWHLDARREKTQCGCIWVFPWGDPSQKYRSWSCLGHRWTRGEKLAKARKGS